MRRRALRALRATLGADGYTVIATSGGDDALSLIDNPRINLVVTELYLRNRRSRCLLRAICAPPPARRAKVLAFTRHSRGTGRAWAVTSGADAYVLKKNGVARLLEVAGKLGGRR